MRAKSVTDVILGEAVSGSRQQRFKDMLAIASVIDNRARASGLSQQDVVAHSGEFNAYNRNLPAGVDQYRGLAEKALNHVAKNGPTHSGMYYATPKAVSNLPDGLQRVATTTGHQFFTDPQGRSFRTAVGWAKPQPSASVLETLSAPVREVVAKVMDALSGAGSAFRTAEFEPVSELPDPNSDLPARQMATVGLAMGKHRPNPPGADFVSLVQDAATDVLGPNVRVDIVSGQGEYGSSRHRDPRGLAGDVRFVDTTTGKRITDPQKMMDVAQAFAAKGGMGVGYGPEYMGNGTMHLDTVTDLHPGQDFEWGSVGNANADLLADARNSALMPSSFYEAALPAEMQAPAGRMPDPLAPAPVGPVDRKPLAPASQRPADLIAAPAGNVQREKIAEAKPHEPDPERFGPRSATTVAKTDRLPAKSDPLAAFVSPAAAATMPNRPASMETLLGQGTVKAPSFASARMTAPAKTTPKQTFEQAPSPQKQAQVYQQAAASRAAPAPAPGPTAAELAAQYGQYQRGTVPQTVDINADLLSSTLLGPKQAFAPKPAQPLFVTAPPQPVTTPKGPRLQPKTVKTPNQRIDEAFSVSAPPAEPQFTASDVYSGRATSGVANDGSKVDRDPFGNISITNEFGATTKVGADGRQMASRPGSSTLSKSGLSDPLKGMFDSLPPGKEIAGSLLGAVLGNMVAGPIGGAVGAKLGQKVSSGNITQNSLLSKLMGGYTTNILGKQMKFANPVAGGPFPNAPSRPSGSDRSYDVSRGRDISPAASREIEAGRGGLY